MISLLSDIVSALRYLHDNKIIHCDIKAANVLVKDGTNPIAMLSDLGYAHAQAGNDATINVRFSISNAHPFLSNKISRSSDPSAVTTTIKRKQLSANYDLFALGKTIESIWSSMVKKLRKKYERTPEEEYGKYKTEYVKVIISRLLSTGAFPSITTEPNKLPSLEEYVPGLKDRILVTELVYKDAIEVDEDLQKLSDNMGLASLYPN